MQGKCKFCGNYTILRKDKKNIYICFECRNKVLECVYCKKELKGRQVKYCSQECKINWKNKNKVRPSWNDLLLNYFDRKCELCKSKENLCLHHIIPLRNNGKNELGNLTCVCLRCHINIHNGYFEKQLNKILKPH